MYCDARAKWLNRLERAKLLWESALLTGKERVRTHLAAYGAAWKLVAGLLFQQGVEPGGWGWVVAWLTRCLSGWMNTLEGIPRALRQWGVLCGVAVKSYGLRLWGRGGVE